MSYTVKSIVLDIADSWGGTLLMARSLEFKLNSILQTIAESDISATYGPQYSTDYKISNLFNTSLSKTGTPLDTSWAGLVGSYTNQRIVCVFVNPVSFDEIVINNHHESGINTDRGLKNVKITISDDVITDTTYNASVSNSTVIYDNIFNEHTSSNIVDDQVLAFKVQIQDFNYNKKFIINGTTSGTLTNYSLKLTVHKSVGDDFGTDVYLGYSCKDHFEDIRFTKSDQSTKLDYWIETSTSGVEATVWVEFDSIPAYPGNSDFYIIYGNEGAVSESNGDNTFLFFDDFEGTSLDTDKWDVNYPGQFTVSDGKVRCVGNSNYPSLISKNTVATPSNGVELNSKIDVISVGIDDYSGYRAHVYNGVAWYVEGNYNRYFLFTDGNEVMSETNTGLVIGEIRTSIQIDSDSVHHLATGARTIDDELVGGIISTPQKLTIFFTYTGYTIDTYFTFVRKCEEVEPTIGFWEIPACRHCPITIQSSKVSGDATNFPVLLTENNLPLEIFTISGDYGANPDASDIRFSTDKDGNNTIPHEIVTFTKATDPLDGKAEIYVNVPNIYAAEDVTIYMRYNDDYPIPYDFNGQMVVDIGSEGTYDTVYSLFSTVINDEGTYKMWYRGRDSSNGDHIIYCDSYDSIHWSNFTKCFSDGAEGVYDTGNIHKACVIKDGTTYKMWYSASDGANQRIIYCTSTNGTTWANFQMVMNVNVIGAGYDDRDVRDPNVIKDGTTYKMWYVIGSISGVYRIAYCTSTDGASWIGNTVIMETGNFSPFDDDYIGTPCVIKDDSIYRMWVYGLSGSVYSIGGCVSINGTSWSNFELWALMGAESVYDSDQIFVSCVLLEDNIYKTWYSGYDGTNYRILYCDSIFPNTPSSKWATWDHNYRLIQHMNEDPSGSAPQMLDSTRYCNHGTSAGGMTSGDLVDGTVGKALNFDGTDDYIDCGNDISTDLGKNHLTLTVMVSSDEYGAGRIFSRRNNFDGQDGYEMTVNSSKRLRCILGAQSSHSYITPDEGPVFTNGVTYCVGAIYNRAGNIKTYVDGEYTTSYSDISSEENYDVTNEIPLKIGCTEANSVPAWLYTGIIDEGRISFSKENDNFMTTQYNNLYTPSTFSIAGTPINCYGYYENAVFFGFCF